MKIRPAKPMDCVEITELWALMNEEIDILGRVSDDYHKQMFMLQLTNSLTRPDTYCVVLEKNKKIVGFMSGYVVVYTHGALNVAVGDLTYILPEYRSGIEFRRMLEGGIDFARKLNCKLFDLNCVPKYKKMYEHMGFTQSVTTMTKEI